MPIAIFLAMMLYQASPAEAPAPAQGAEAPAEPAAAPNDIDAASAASNLPKDDYGLVAWCHGALAGQLELDPIAHADMISIEGKAKVAARAKSDAEMEKDRREYLHDYERALAAAEKASPTAIHEYGVESELSGYKLWGATRQKQPIWRMLDWGMWDPNDAGCGDAAKRLYNKATLFGEALKGSSDEKAEVKSETDKVELKAYPDPSAKPGGDAGPTSEAAPTAADAAAAPEATPPVTAPVAAAPTPAAKAARSKTVAGKSAKTKVATKTAAAPPVETPASAPEAPPADPTAPAAPSTTPADSPLRGPQS